MLKLGVDVGGTFTDLVMIDEKNGEINLTKVLSTPRNPDQGVLNGIKKMTKLFSMKAADIDFLIHGTTVATNALIERKGVETALIVTKGFKDILHIGRQVRPKLYDFFERRADPFIRRKFRYEVPERTLYTGEVELPLDEIAVRSVADELAKNKIGVVAVCLLHSYINPSHEVRVREILKEKIPSLRVCLSSEILPEFKEYERMSTTVINAYVMPIIETYLLRILKSIRHQGVKSDLHIMQSNGGVMTSETASQKSVHTVLSGPAAGVLGGIEISKLIDEKNIITIDMGGTSFDVSLAYQGRPTFTMENDIDGHVIKVPMIDIKTLGAGGGSIAWIDAGGALQVGPESSGSDPGPVCYCRGGKNPTVSDANVVLGYLNPKSFAGGELTLDVDSAKKVIKEKIADPMGLSLEEAAEGILKVVNATMIRGIRLVSVEKGYDPREFSLVCFGGAGPVHAIRLAQELKIPKIIVPEAAGVCCALGLLMADFRHDYSKTFFHPLKGLLPENLVSEFIILEKKATAQMIHERIPEKDIIYFRSADMRYQGQGYELEVPLPMKIYDENDLLDICNEFQYLHNNSYGYKMSPESAELVNIRLTVIGKLSKPEIKTENYAGEDSRMALKGNRKVFMDGSYRMVPIYDRKLLRFGNQIKAPAIVDQVDATTVIFDGRASVDQYRNLIVDMKRS